MAMAIDKLPETSRVQNIGRHTIFGYAGEDQKLNTAVLQTAARHIEMEVFGVERTYALEDVAFNLRHNGSMTVVVDNGTGEPVGYSSQQVLMPPLPGNRFRVMMTTTRAMKEPVQGEELGPATLRFSCVMHNAPDIIVGIMGWAPPVVTYYKSGIVEELQGDKRAEAEARVTASGDDELDEIRKQLAVVKLYPFFRRHTDSPLMSDVLDYIMKQSRYSGVQYDPATGLMEGLWEKDSTMLFRAEKASRRVSVVGQILQDELNCDPTKGSAIVVMGLKKGWKPVID